MKNYPLIARIGTFLILLGIGVSIIFITSDLAQTPDFDFLFIAIGLITVGWLFQRRRPPPPASGRFSLLRRMRGGQAENTDQSDDEKDR